MFNKIQKKGLFHHNKSRGSISRDYYIYGAFILIIATTSSIWSAWRLHNTQKKALENQLTTEARLLDSELNNYFKYVSHIAEDKGHKITLKSPNDLENIAYIFKRVFFFSITETGFKNKAFRWPHFSWVDKDNNILVTSEEGILEKPIKTKEANHLYLSSKDFWELHLSDPKVIDGKAYIPGSLGVASVDDEKHIGTITTHFSVDELIKAIKTRLKSNIPFIILNERFEVIIKSYSNDVSTKQNNIFAKELNGININQNALVLENTIQYDNHTYRVVKKSSDYPFILAIGHNNNNNSTFMNSFVIKGLEVFGAAIILLTILAFQRRRIIQPIEHLADVAKRVAKGTDHVEIREHNKNSGKKKKYPIEIHKLREAVLYTKIFMNKERKSRARAEKSEQELEEFNIELKRKNEAAKKSRKLLDKFLHEVRRGTVEESIIRISQDLSLLRERENNKVKMSQKQALELFNKQLERCARIITYTSDELELTTVNAEELIDECIELQNHSADIWDVELIPNINISQNQIQIDKRGIQQVITSLIYYLIEDRKKESPSFIKISAKTKTTNKKQFLEIKFEGNGNGIDEEIRIEFEKTRESEGQHTNSTALDLYIIKHIIAMHKGNLKLENIVTKGTTITVTLPYEIENKNKKEAKNPEKKQSGPKKSSSKIINLFPDKKPK